MEYGNLKVIDLYEITHILARTRNKIKMTNIAESGEKYTEAHGSRLLHFSEIADINSN